MTASFETLLYSVEDGIATITLNRPSRMNALTYAMGGELIEAFDRTDGDDAVRAVIVTGAGERAFSAGADLSQGAKAFDLENRTDQGARPTVGGVYPDTGGRVALRIFDSLKPVIGAVNGVAVGFGATILLPMDVRLAAHSARFGFVFGRLGIVPESAATWFLPRIVGISTALDWCYSARLFDAAEALDRGLVRAVHPDAELMACAKAIARTYADACAPVSVALTRQMLWKMLGADHPMEAHVLESKVITVRGRGADAKAGLAASAEKRRAEFPEKVSTDMPDFFPWWSERPFG